VYKLNPDMFVKASHQPRTCIRPEVVSIVASGAIRSMAEATVVAVDQGPRFPDSESTAPSLLSQNTGLFIVIVLVSMLITNVLGSKQEQVRFVAVAKLGNCTSAQP
jgi:hypothetical protein